MPHIHGNKDWQLAAHTTCKNLAEHRELNVAIDGQHAQYPQTSPGGARDQRLSDARQRMADAGGEVVNVGGVREDLSGAGEKQGLA
ncbi:Asp-tRNA(Asn)/Glu-tRNA(Gln) amidotransferase GatCAB subunit C, partial [Pseudomonas syringae pv. tagetis]